MYLVNCTVLSIDNHYKKCEVYTYLISASRFKDTDQYRSQTFEAMAPLMLPELSKLSQVVIEEDSANHRYWPVWYAITFLVFLTKI